MAMSPYEAPRNPYPKVRFFAGEDSSPMIEVILSADPVNFLSAGDGDRVCRPALEMDRENYPAAWQAFVASQRKGGAR